MLKHLIRSLVAVLVFTLLLGGLYPILIWGIGQVFFNNQANGSLIKDKNNVILGSTMIGQKFTTPKYLWSRPSAIDYDGLNSGYGELNITSKEFWQKHTTLKNQSMPDELTVESASGLDPHISLNSALLQADRISKIRNINKKSVEDLIVKYSEKNLTGYTYVNVLKINLALDGKIYE